MSVRVISWVLEGLGVAELGAIVVPVGLPSPSGAIEWLPAVVTGACHALALSGRHAGALQSPPDRDSAHADQGADLLEGHVLLSVHHPQSLCVNVRVFWHVRVNLLSFISITSS